MSHPKVTIFTDGGCRPNPGPGGWGAVFVARGRLLRELKGSSPDTTNNRMELTAAIESLRSLAEPHEVELVTDSEYLRRGISEWMKRWRASGWLTADKTPVANRDLWQVLDSEIQRHRVRWRWTKGHAGNRWNERADRLASSAIPGDKEGRSAADGAVRLWVAAAYSGKLARGGWGAVLQYREHRKTISGHADRSSANRMHLLAVMSGLRLLKRSMTVDLYTVSDYVSNGAASWVNRWRERGWRTAEGRAVANADVWSELASLLQRHEVTIHVVDRDDGDDMAEAKRLAREAMRGIRAEDDLP